ncbi:MAG: LemA family protein [Gemmatimonadota bacterium]|jgi:LemA protein
MLGLILFVVVVFVLPAVYAVMVYNGLVSLRVRTDNAWSDIDVQLKRRHDLIPNVVNTVKGYASHERETLESVTSARTQAMQAASAGPAERSQAEGALSQALGRLFAVAESYPQLRAAEPFQELQRTLSQIEDAVQNARRYYNAVVRDLNTKVQQFPSNIIANASGFRVREFFELEDEGERAVPDVEF